MNELPFGEDVFAEVRKDVMARIARPRKVVPVWAYAAAAIAVVIMLVYPKREELPVNAPAHPRVAQAFQPALPALDADWIVRATPKPKKHHVRPAVIEPVRIEIQTGDPDVRIIWISDRRTHETAGNDVPRSAAGDHRRGR
jgi:hypothetical protein